MILRKNRYKRIRVIGGSGIFDSIMNILKKPIVSKLLTSAGKSIASKLGETLVSKVVPPAPQQVVIQPKTVNRADDLITKYGSSIHDQQDQQLLRSFSSQAGLPAQVSKDDVITIDNYVKKVRGAGIKLV